MAEKTSLPWSVDFHSHIRAEDIRAEDGTCVANVWTIPNQAGQQRANAAFIVKAVNAHDALVKALEECASRCRYDGDLFFDQGNELRMRASWDAADRAETVLTSIKETV